MKLLIMALALAALTACGGGDPEDDRRTTEPVNCNQPGTNQVCTAARSLNLRVTSVRIWK